MPRKYDVPKLKFLQQNISRARNRGKKTWPIEIDKFDAYDVGEKQNWLCANILHAESRQRTKNGFKAEKA